MYQFPHLFICLSELLFTSLAIYLFIFFCIDLLQTDGASGLTGNNAAVRVDRIAKSSPGFSLRFQGGIPGASVMPQGGAGNKSVTLLGKILFSIFSRNHFFLFFNFCVIWIFCELMCPLSLFFHLFHISSFIPLPIFLFRHIVVPLPCTQFRDIRTDFRIQRYGYFYRTCSVRAKWNIKNG